MRTVPMFKEEFTPQNPSDAHYISIREFQQENLYTAETRNKLITYVHSCPHFVATSFKRFHPYQEQFHWELSYYTDGEVIFNNFLLDYISRNDFALPRLWFELIKERQFKLNPFQIDMVLASNGEIDIFKTAKESFQEIPTVKKIILDSNN